MDKLNNYKIFLENNSNISNKKRNKYEIFDEVQDAFLYLTDGMNKCEEQNYNCVKRGEYLLYLNDTRLNQYADNNYTFYMSLEGLGLPYGYSNDIDFLKTTPFYKELKSSLNRLKQIKQLKQILFYCNNGKDGRAYMEIKMIVNHENKFIPKNDKYLKSFGFEVGSNMIDLKVGNYIIKTNKPIPRDDKEYYSLAKSLTVLDSNWNIVCQFAIDERGFNILRESRPDYPGAPMLPSDRKISTKIFDEYEKMKGSNPEYGTYINNASGKEGKKCLYAHDFIIWLKNNL